MNRKLGFFGLLWASQGSMIGSGWLFGALTAVGIAGPSALLAWAIGTVIILLLALVHAELGGLLPVSGGTSRYPHYAFGSLAGATFGWFSYLQAAATAPIEVLAVIQYVSTYEWAERLHMYQNGALAGWGILLAVVLMLFFAVVNLIGIHFLAKVNNTLTSLKLLLPVVAVIVLLTTDPHPGNFTAGGGFFVPGAGFSSVIIAVPGAVIFSLMGFEQAVQLGGESKNPKRDLPRAVIASILFGAVTYIGVQIAFIVALDPALLSNGRTWADLVDPNTTNPALVALQSAPFYQVALLAGVGWLAALLRLDAIVSPGGTGLIYLTSSSRVSFGLSRSGYLPKAFENTSARSMAPVFGILVSTVIGLIFLLPFPSWGELVGLVATASVLMYAGAPLALGALRRQTPDLPRSYRLPFARVLAPAAFILANYIVMWSGWNTYTTLMLALLVGFALMALSSAFRLNPNRAPIDWGAGAWLFPYLLGLGVITYFTQYGHGSVFGGVGVFDGVWVGGNGELGLGWDMVVMAVFSLVIYHVAMAKRLPSAHVERNISHADLLRTVPSQRHASSGDSGLSPV